MAKPPVDRVDIARRVWRGILRARKAWESRRVRIHRAKSHAAILKIPPVPVDPQSPVEIHALTCERDYTDLLWCLKTFFHFSDRRCNVVLHDDGSLSRPALDHLSHQLPGATIIAKDRADERMREVLQDHEACRVFRNRLPLARKLFDFPSFATRNEFLILDSDILFFAQPKDMLHRIDCGRPFFMSDYQDGYVYSRTEIRNRYGVEPLPAVNTGIAYLSKTIVDYGMVETYCRDLLAAGLDHHGWAEQTLFALLLSRYPESVDRLPDGYRISCRPINSATISHHFVNDGSRGLFYTHGVRHLCRADFLADYTRKFGGARPGRDPHHD